MRKEPRLPSENIPRLAAELRALRVQRGLTLSRVAREIGVDKGSLSRYELGKDRPPMYVLGRLKERYGLTGLELHELQVWAGHMLPDGSVADTRPRPESPTDPLGLVVAALQRGGWPENVCAAVYALLAAPVYERARVQKQLAAALDRRLAEPAATYAVGAEADPAALARVILADALVEVFGPSDGTLPALPANS